MSYVRTVPVLRTPAGLDAFDYALPEGMDAAVGDLVWVPFRRAKTPALVIEKTKTSPYADRAQNVIGSYAGVSLPEVSVGLLRWLSEWTFTSQPSVLLAWMRGLPKRPKEQSALTHAKRGKGSMTAEWTADADKKLIQAAIKMKGRTLIVTPWLESARRLAERLPEATLLLATDADGTYFETWTSWMSSASGIVITTRVGSWLAPIADTVLLHLPEQDDHKQDELSPRYDSRRIAAWSAQHAGTEVNAFGVTPSLTSDEQAPTIELPFHVLIRSPRDRSPIPIVRSDALNMIRDHEGPRVIIHPIRGRAAHFTCRDCGWQASCSRCAFPLSDEGREAACRRCGLREPAPLTCASCGGMDLGKSVPGIERLKSAWATHEPEIEVEWRTMIVNELQASLPEGCVVLMTDASLLAGVVEDIRRDERLVVAVRDLAARVQSVHGTLILQAPEHLEPLLQTCLTKEGFDAHRSRERALRAEFGYPPSVRLVKALVDGTDTDALGWIERIRPKVVAAGGELRGPFQVAYRPKSRKSRWIIHAVFPLTIEQKTLFELFSSSCGVSRDASRLRRAQPSRVITDLDPIAFFR